MNDDKIALLTNAILDLNGSLVTLKVLLWIICLYFPVTSLTLTNTDRNLPVTMTKEPSFLLFTQSVTIREPTDNSTEIRDQTIL